MSNSPSIGLSYLVRFFNYYFYQKKNECSPRSDGFGVPLFEHYRLEEKPLKSVCVCPL